MKDWLESYKHNLEENTYDSYFTVVTKISEYFLSKNINKTESANVLANCLKVV